MSDVAAYRIYKSVRAATAMTGEGAKKFGGRWNSPGVAVVYCSSSLALAQLEVLVHFQGVSPPATFEFIELSIPMMCQIRTIAQEDLENLFFDWRAHPPHVALQELGDDWIARCEFPVLKVPSAVSPSEFNYLLNPAHPDFSKVETQESRPLDWDERLIERFGS